MIERAVHRAEKRAVIGPIVGIVKLRRGGVKPAIGPSVVPRQHVQNRFHRAPYDCVVLVNQRISGNDTARGKARTVFRKPATWGGNAIS